jgi:hypothetical protein
MSQFFSNYLQNRDLISHTIEPTAPARRKTMLVRKTYVRSLLIVLAMMLTLSAHSQSASNNPPEPTGAVAVATADNPVTHEENSRVPEGAAWTQHYFPSSDGSDVELHADVLLPEGLAEGEKVPVILSVGAYFGHSGQMNLENHAHTRAPPSASTILLKAPTCFSAATPSSWWTCAASAVPRAVWTLSVLVSRRM